MRCAVQGCVQDNVGISQDLYIPGYPIDKGQKEAGIKDSFVKLKRLKAGLDD